MQRREFSIESYTDHEKAIPQLLAAGLDINKGSADRQCTALMTACCYGHSACVEQLLKAGADVTLKVGCLLLAGMHSIALHTL